MTSPLRVSSPASRTLSPGDGTFFSSKLSPQPEVFSTMTTASAASGMPPPVKILMASPSPTLFPAGRPAGASSTTGKTRPTPASALRIANPSTAELSKGGESVVASRSRASASPRASPSGTSSTGSRGVLWKTSRSASAYSMSFSKSCTFTPLPRTDIFRPSPRVRYHTPERRDGGWTTPGSNPRQQRHGPARATGGTAYLDRQKDEVRPAHGQHPEVRQDLHVAHPAAQTLLVYGDGVVGAPDAGGVYADGLHAALVEVDGRLGRRGGPARRLARDERSAHVPLPPIALDVVAVPPGPEEHDLALLQAPVLAFPGLDVVGPDKRAHARLATLRQGSHVHHGRRSHQVFQRNP